MAAIGMAATAYIQSRLRRLLKTKFSSTSYAAATPYWFDCMDSVWDDKGERVTNCKPKEWPKQAHAGQNEVAYDG